MTDTTTDRGGWIVQDVFSSGTPGPGFTFHATIEEARQESKERDASPPMPYRECETCTSVLGLHGMPLQGGCNYCR